MEVFGLMIQIQQIEDYQSKAFIFQLIRKHKQICDETGCCCEGIPAASNLDFEENEDLKLRIFTFFKFIFYGLVR